MSHNRSAVTHGRRQKILEAFRDADKPVLTTKEIHETVGGVSLETIRDDLKKMRGSELDGRETSQDYVWWVDRRAVGGTTDDKGVATGEELRNAVAAVVTERYDFRLFFMALVLLAVNSFAGVGIYLMLEFDNWLLPLSVQQAIVYTYTPIVVLGMLIAVSGTIVLVRERLQ